MNPQASPADPCETAAEDGVVLKRFLIALAIFVGLVIPGAFMMALLAASAYPAPAVAHDGYAVTKTVAPAAAAR